MNKLNISWHIASVLFLTAFLFLSTGAIASADFDDVTPVETAAAAKIGGMLFIDSNGNGQREAAESAGVAGVALSLHGPGGTIRSTLSDANGRFLFDGLVPGTYQLMAPAYAPGLALSTPSPQTLTLSAGQMLPDVDFGYVAPTALELVDLTAERLGAAVAVRWTTSFEQGEAGFVIWRAFSENGLYVIVSDAIPARNQPAGASYEWLDINAPPAAPAWYQVQTLPYGQLFGPVQTGEKSIGATARTLIFTPLVIR